MVYMVYGVVWDGGRSHGRPGCIEPPDASVYSSYLEGPSSRYPPKPWRERKAELKISSIGPRWELTPTTTIASYPVGDSAASYIHASRGHFWVRPPVFKPVTLRLQRQNMTNRDG